MFNLKRKKLIASTIIMSVLILIFLSVCFIYKYYHDNIYMPADKKGNIKNVELDIKGSASNDIPNSLYDAGLIKSKISFKVYVRYHHFYDKLKAGKYDFNTGMSTAQIVDKMVKGQVKDDTVKVVIPEGYTVKKVADVLQDAGLFSAQEFLDAAQNTNFDFDFLNYPAQKRLWKLEGYLFPDTYVLSKKADPETVIKKMLGRFDQIFDENMRSQAKAKNMSIDQVVTVASIIEREAKVENERPIMAAVYYNRLKKKMPLQVDATVLYALGKWKDKVFLKDLKVDSPYNTYKYAGLPVGPISNPGKSSLVAALNPENVNYLYYVLKKGGNGEHVFSNTYSEHMKSVSANK